MLKKIKKHKWGIAAGLILTVMFLVALASSSGFLGNPGDSAIVDEVAHIPAGYSYDKYFDYRLNPEHPPLAKALAGLPLALNSRIHGIKDNWSWNGINQWESGWYILYHAGNDPANILFWSRLPMILLMIGLGLFLFKWARELYGDKIGLIVLVLYAFYPDVLAHGRLVTTDIAAAFGYVIAMYYFEKAVSAPTRRSIIIAGIAFGLAQLLKFSAFLLFGIFFIMVIYRALLERKDKGFWRSFWSYFKPYLGVVGLSLVVVWLVYLPFVWNTPASIEHQVIQANLLPSEHRLDFLRNFLHHFENNPFARAIGHYLLGVALVIGRVEGGNTTYILGHLSDKGISWYFPVAWLLKTPVSIILLGLSALGYTLWGYRRQSVGKRWMLFVIMIPIAIYWAFTLKGSLNIGIRHLMPTVPFVLLLIGYFIHQIRDYKYSRAAIGILVAYLVVSTLSNYPNFIAYFNEFTPRDQRYTKLIDSSLDWGQDLLRLKKYVDDNHIKSIKVDYFGGSVPSYYIPQSVGWHSSYGPTTGWLAVSATFYQSSKLLGSREGKWSYAWLDGRKPATIIGGSILVYNITAEELAKNPPVSAYPIRIMEYPATVGGNQGKVGL